MFGGGGKGGGCVDARVTGSVEARGGGGSVDPRVRSAGVSPGLGSGGNGGGASVLPGGLPGGVVIGVRVRPRGHVIALLRYS
jgi:hypothetical protein